MSTELQGIHDQIADERHLYDEGALAERKRMEWQPASTAPKDGSRIWGWLYDSGIHLMRWMTAQDNADDAGDPNHPEDYIDCWVKATQPDDGDWKVEFWLPESAIPVPPGVAFVHDLNRWRDV